MENDRKILYTLVILIALVSVLSVVLYINFNKNTFSEENTNDFSKQMGYSVVKVINKNDEFLREEFFIVSESGMLLDTRIIETWSDVAAFNQKYANFTTFPLIYNTQKNFDSIAYNTTISNGKNINEIISIKEKDVNNEIIKY